MLGIFISLFFSNGEDKYGNKLSVLGFGCMRLPKDENGVDYKNTKLLEEFNDFLVNVFHKEYVESIQQLQEEYNLFEQALKDFE